jgi:predicted metal-binding membrane protein
MDMCTTSSTDLRMTIAMWVAMSLIMMLPSALPMISAFGRVTRQLNPGHHRAAMMALFVLMYCVIWSVFGTTAGAAEWTLSGVRLIDNGQLQSGFLTGGLLIVSGMYQFSAVKNLCLSQCRSPLSFLLENYRSGYGGVMRVGVLHGLFCLGCCWALMLLAWVGGAMNLLWMLTLTILVSAEKVLGAGRFLKSLLGVTLLACGFAKIGATYFA